jgi:hypothetical protein
MGSNNFFTVTRHDVGHADLSKKATLSCRAITSDLRVQKWTAVWRYGDRLCSLKLDSHRRIRLD